MNHPIRVMQVVGRMMGGGVEATVMNHYRHINRERIQFDFIVQSDSMAVPSEEINALGGRIFEVPPYRNPITYMRECACIFKKTRPLIVHSHMNTISLFALRAAKQAGIPIRIAHSHSTANPNEKVKTTIKNFLRPFSRIYPTHLAACGEYSARWLFGNTAVNSGKVKIIRNAIDLSQFSFNTEARNRLRAEIGANEQTLVIGQIGRFCAQKNQLFSIQVMNEILQRRPDAMLVFLGVGDDANKIYKEVRKLGIENNVHFLGLRQDACSWYSAFDILLFPSLYEGLPLTVIEAQASNLPIVASNQITEEAFIIPALCNVFSLSQGPVEWAKNILTITNQHINIRKNSDTLLSLEKAGYDINLSSQNLCNWYESLLK